MDQAAGVGSGCQVGQMAISLGLEGTGPGGDEGTKREQGVGACKNLLAQSARNEVPGRKGVCHVILGGVFTSET